MTLKGIAVRAAGLLAVAGLLAPVGAWAVEMPGSNRLVADIPFSFIVGKTQLPAGRYEVTVGPGEEEQHVLAIQTADSNKSEMRFRKVYALMVPTDQVNLEKNQPRLVFKEVGNLYFLDKVVPTSGHQLAKR